MPTHVAGPVFTAEGFRPGVITLDEAGRIAEVAWDAPAPRGAVEGVVLPRFVNAHTHVGDRFAKGRIPAGMSLEALVKPPDGLKHRLLREAPPGAVAAGIRDAAREMLATGTRAFLDFREMGVAGVRDLQEGTRDLPGLTPVPLGRPARPTTDPGELDEVLRAGAAGFGLPALTDLPFETAQAWAAAARRRGLRFAMHASEGVRDDIEQALALRPDFLVHMVKATREDLARCAEARVPIVVCPRSNAYFGLTPDVPAMLAAGVTVGIGTDNAMLQDLDLLNEMAFLHLLHPSLPRESILRMATHSGAQIFKGTPDDDFLKRGAPGDLLVLRARGEDPLDAVFAPSPERALVLAEGRSVPCSSTSVS